MREEDDDRFDELDEDAPTPPPPPFPSHIVLPMPAWGAMIPWASPPESAEEEHADEVEHEAEEEELTEEEANRRWLRAEVEEYFTLN